MSGTSLDGLDIALCRVTDSGPNTSLDLLRFETKGYTDDFRSRIRQVFALQTVDQQLLCGLHPLIGRVHGAMVNDTLREWGISPEAIDLIASHGQTVFHAPQSLTGSTDYPNSTMQLGDGDHLAVATDIITVSDFRQKHLAAGGEGAPLAAYGDNLLFAAPQETRVLLNIGGIANFTLLPATAYHADSFATDVGPGNSLMNQYMQWKQGEEMDLDGRMASAGMVNQPLLDALLDHNFFRLPFPKTTGPELFNLPYLTDAQHASGTENLSIPDVMATLTAFSASAISTSILHAVQQRSNPHVYISGGGLHNPVLVDLITRGLKGVPVSSFEKLGLMPDAKEAALFALLANETVAGSTNNVPINGAPAVYMGKISFPK